MVIFPLSKINLGLNIVRKRTDGYHDLQTIFVPIGWTDILEAVPANGDDTTLTITGNSCNCPTESNLVIKALRAVEKACGKLPAVNIYLRKIVPDGAGLGGGSADAAAMVKCLNSIFALGMGNEMMSEICSTVGADCPFFIHKQPMVAEGTGTDLRPIDIPAIKGLNIIVAKPPVSVSTKEAYAGVIPSEEEIDLEALASLPVREWKEHFVNGFEETIFPSHPGIKAIKDYFYSTGAAYSSMSGSGTAVYALYEGDILADYHAAPLVGSAIWSGTIE